MMSAKDFTASGFPLYELLDGFIADDCVVDARCHISGMSLDSRQIEKDFLFVACQGTQQHGLAYAQDAVNAGAAAIIYEKSLTRQAEISDYLNHLQSADIPLIEVDELNVKVGFIADRFYARPSQSLKVTGITGTNGKTSCSHYLAGLLSNTNKTAVMGTLGNGLYGNLQITNNTTADAITVHHFMADMQRQEVSDVVMEVSSHGLDQGRVNGVHFDTAIFTNLSRDHLDYHQDMTHYAESKQKLFSMPGLRYAVINADDEFGRQILETLPDTVQSVAYSLSDAMNADASVLRNSLMHLGCVQGSDLQFTEAGLSMQISSPWGDTVVKSTLYGRFNAENILAVLACSLVNGMRLSDAVEGIEKLTAVAGRMQRIAANKNQPIVIVDYAHTPDALEQLLTSVRTHCKKRLWCVFGCGGDRDTGKRPLMGTVADLHADEVVLTDDNPRSEASNNIIQQIAEGIKRIQHLTIEPDRSAAIKYAITNASAGDVVVIAGKGHENYQILGDRRLSFSDIETAEKILGESQQ